MTIYTDLQIGSAFSLYGTSLCIFYHCHVSDHDDIYLWILSIDLKDRLGVDPLHDTKEVRTFDIAGTVYLVVLRAKFIEIWREDHRTCPVVVHQVIVVGLILTQNHFFVVQQVLPVVKSHCSRPFACFDVRTAEAT